MIHLQGIEPKGVSKTLNVRLWHMYSIGLMIIVQ